MMAEPTRESAAPRGVASLRTPRREHGFEPLTPSAGVAPPQLSGRLYRVGPGRFETSPRPTAHWFDADGLLTAIDFHDGRAAAAVRLIRPAGADRPNHAKRGRFGAPPVGLHRRLRGLVDPKVYVNAANTALLAWDDRLFALYEGDLPTEIDAETLATRAPTDLGVIRRTFSAHPKRHRPSGALINQGFRPPPKKLLDYYRLDPDGTARPLASAPYGGAILMHDFAVTDRWIVTLCPPIFLDLRAVLLRGAPLANGLRWRAEAGAEILLTPLAPTGDVAGPCRSLATDAVLYTHTANAFEQDGDIILQGVAAEGPEGLDWIASIRAGAAALAPSSPGYLTEFRIRPETGLVERRRLSDHAIDFPVVDDRRPGRRRWVYAAGFRAPARAYADLFDVLLKIDTATGAADQVDFGDGHFVSEALFAPRPGAVRENDGWLLALNYDANRDESYVAILDAGAGGARPEILATLPLGQALPISFHGLWRPRPAAEESAASPPD